MENLEISDIDFSITSFSGKLFVYLPFHRQLCLKNKTIKGKHAKSLDNKAVHNTYYIIAQKNSLQNLVQATLLFPLPPKQGAI
jgi:hypothetical protein